MRISAVVLAAGESRRFGRNKLEVRVKGRGLLEHVISAAVNSLVDDVVCVTHSIRGHSTMGSKMISYVSPSGELLSDSLKAGLEAVSLFSDAVVILLGDMVCVKSYLINTLISIYYAHPGDPIASRRDGLLIPPILIPRRYFPMLLKLKGDAGARYLIRRMNGVRAVNITNIEALDIDVQEDLELFHKCEDV